MGASIGHNSNFGGIAADRLRSFVERIERVQDEIDALNGDKKEIYSEAKATGFDVKILKMVIRDRKMDPSDRNERDELYAIYVRALELGGASESDGTKNATRAHAHEEPPAEAGEQDEEIQSAPDGAADVALGADPDEPGGDDEEAPVAPLEEGEAQDSSPDEPTTPNDIIDDIPDFLQREE